MKENPTMKNNIILAILIVILQSGSYSQITSFGLEGKTVNCIELRDNVLYVGTTDDGVFRRALDDTGWVSLGLQGKLITSLYPHSPDSAGFSMLAGLHAYRTPDDTTLIFGLTGSGWVPADSGVNKSISNTISSINGALKSDGTHLVFADGYSPVYRRDDKIWGIVFSQSYGNVVDISPFGQIWAGGMTGFSYPFITKSTDEGENWSGMAFFSSGPDAFFSLAFSPLDSDIVYGSRWSGIVMKTTNGGTDWNVISDSVWRAKVAIDPLVPDHLFCGGEEASRGELIESNDGGATWHDVSLPDSVKQITSLTISARDSLDVYLATRGSGVYHFRQFTPAFGLNVSPEWNMISIPKHVPDYRSASLFPGSSSGAFSYEGSYHLKDTLEHGKGYWLKYPSAQFLRIGSGENINSDTINVNAGWNMIGSISKPVKTSTITSDPPGIVTSLFHTYHGSYSISDSIKPGSAYWVKVSQSGQLVLSASSVASASNRIRIVPSSELPPPPPGVESANPATQIPHQFALEQNYPNPFNPTTRFSYALPLDVHVTLTVYNVLGQVVATVVDEIQEAGFRSVEFNAGSLSSGIYYYRLTAGEFTEIKKMLLLK